MASFWKKISKTFLTLLLMLGVFFAGCVGLAPTKTASATFIGTYSNGYYVEDNTLDMYICSGEGDTIIGVDSEGSIYKGTSLTNFEKTGTKLPDFGIPTSEDYYNYSRLGNENGQLVNGSNLILNHNGTIVVIGYTNNGVRSYVSVDNGTSWKNSVIFEQQIPTKFVAGNGSFVLLTYNNTGKTCKEHYSTDGINWTSVDFYPYSEETGYFPFAELTFVNGYFIATTVDNDMDRMAPTLYPGFYRSIDGINWELMDNATQVDNAMKITGVTRLYSPGQISICYINGYYLLSFEGKMFISPDLYEFFELTVSGLDYTGGYMSSLQVIGQRIFITLAFNAGVYEGTLNVDSKTIYFENLASYGIQSTIYPGEVTTTKSISDLDTEKSYATNIINYGSTTYGSVTTAFVINTKNNIYFVSTGNASTLAVYQGYSHVTKNDYTGNSVQRGLNYEISRENVHASILQYAITELHTVTFKDWNGNVLDVITIYDGDILENTPTPTRIGYTFVGWDYDLTQPVTKDLTLTANYTINKHRVLFVDYNGQTIAEVYVSYGDQLSAEEIPTPSDRVGYQFIGWDKDINQNINSNVTFVAKYSSEATLTIKYYTITGRFGLDNQFYKTEEASKSFTYLIGDTVKNDEFTNWYNENILPWINDFTTDGDYDYDTRFIAWNLELPTTIEQDLTITAETEKLINVRLDYYSQLRFKTSSDMSVPYYIPFIGNMKIERLLPAGTILNLEDFKDPAVDYEIYNSSQNSFYNNLRYFQFLGWDYDIEEPIIENKIIKAQYKMPVIEVRMYDVEGYLFKVDKQDVSFLSVEDLATMISSNAFMADNVRELIKNFLTLQWGEAVSQYADLLDLTDYVGRIIEVHKNSRQILTGYVVIDTDNENLYGGIFRSGSINLDSAVLTYFTGTTSENNMSYWINPIIFSTDAYKLTCSVNYNTVLGSALKVVSKAEAVVTAVWDWLVNFIKEYWWVIVLVVLAIIFRKPLIAALTMLFGAIKKGAQKLSAKIKSKSKNSKYKKTEKEYTAVKKESKKKEK